MERNAQLNINNAIVVGIFHEECYPSTDYESHSYYYDKMSTVFNNSNNSISGLNDRALENSFSDKESVILLDEYIESAYHNCDNHNTLYEGNASDNNSYTQDNEEYLNSNSTYHTQKDEESVNSGSINEVIQNIDMLNQDDVVININQHSYNKTIKLVRHFKEGSNMPCYTILAENRTTSGVGSR